LPTAIARLEPRIARVADVLFDEIVPLGRGDFVELYALPFPAIVIGELLGVRPEDQADFGRWSLLAVSALTGGGLGADPGAKRATEDCVEAQIDARLTTLDTAGAHASLDAIGEAIPDDVSSRLAVALRDGQVSREETRHLGYQLLVAGHETTSSLIGFM